MHIFLIRHGHRFHTPPDPELTEQGHQQAKLTGEWLKQYPITKVISSPFKRTVQTTQGILKSVDLPLETNEKLQERMEYDSAKYSTWESFLKEWVQSSRDRSYQPRVGRSSQQAGNEVKQIIEEMNRANHSHLVLVSHGGTIADFLRTVLNDQALAHILVPVEYKEGETVVRESDYLMRHCAVSHLEFNEDQWISHMIDNVDHLGEFFTPAP